MKHSPPVKTKKLGSPDRGSSLLEEYPMIDPAVRALVEYLEVSSAPPEATWPWHWFEEVSFSRWAAEEILNAILDHPTIPAEDTIFEFAMKMTAYKASSDGLASERIFSIAAEFAYECHQNITTREETP